MPFHGLNSSFCLVGSLLEECHELPFDVVVGEVSFEFVRAFIIKHLELRVVAVDSEEEVCVCVRVGSFCRASAVRDGIVSRWMYFL